MQASNRNPFNREDTLLGVCQAVGDEFGFNPNYLRIALSVSLLWNPTIIIGGYFALGFAVMVARLIAPMPKPRTAPRVEVAPATAQPVPAEANAHEELAIAA